MNAEREVPIFGYKWASRGEALHVFGFNFAVWVVSRPIRTTDCIRRSQLPFGGEHGVETRTSAKITE